MVTNLVEIDGLSGFFETIGGDVRALNGVDLGIEEGKVTGLVGETGSGKTMASLSISRLMPENFRYTHGEVRFRGENLLEWPEEKMAAFRGKNVSISFQDPKAALNPVFTVDEQLRRVFRTHTGATKREAKSRVLETLDRVRISDPKHTSGQYAHELSGGMAQRVMIAMAVIHPPDLLILDEPTTGLDVTVQDEIIDMLRGLVSQLGITVLLITHDLGVVGELCDNVAVMYAGRIMEFGCIQDVFERSANPYTRQLLRSTESVEGGVGDLYSIPGAPPDLRSLPDGCYFEPRCPAAENACEQTPGVVQVGTNHLSLCHFADRFVALPGLLDQRLPSSDEEVADE